LYATEDIKKLKTETDGVYEVSYEGGYQYLKEDKKSRNRSGRLSMEGRSGNI
jgi:hypothetical protein